MNYLTAQQVIFIHARLIDETGGVHGIRDLGSLESAVSRARASFDGDDLYVGVFAKAAALLQSLIRNHPFIDGNKRTGIAAAGIFLWRNGFAMDASDEDLVKFCLDVVTIPLENQAIEEWLKNHSIRAA